MRLSRPDFGQVSLARIVLVLGLAGLVAGCDTQAGRDASDSTIGVFRMLAGPSEEPDELQVDPNAPPPEAPGRCPPVVIREGTETFRSYERGLDGDPAAVIYQGGIQKVARECEVLSDTALNISFGAAGKVITGPKWAGATTVRLPMRAAFVRSGGEAVWSQLYEIDVAMIPGENVAQFVHVEEELYYELPEGAHINDYVIYVGFDEQGGR